MNPDVVKNKIYDDHFTFISPTYRFRSVYFYFLLLPWVWTEISRQPDDKKIWPNTLVFIIYISDIVKSAKYLFIYFQPVAICL